MIGMCVVDMHWTWTRKAKLLLLILLHTPFSRAMAIAIVLTITYRHTAWWWETQLHYEREFSACKTRKIPKISKVLCSILNTQPLFRDKIIRSTLDPNVDMYLPGLSMAAWLQAITAATASVVVSNSRRPELERSDFIGNNFTAFGGRTS